VRYSQRYVPRHDNHHNSNNSNNKNVDQRTKIQDRLEEKRQNLDQKGEWQHQKHNDLLMRSSFQDLKQEYINNAIASDAVVGQRYRPTVKRQHRYPRILYFLHIHKSAGTTFCRQAYFNRISANYERNCNVQADQRCCGHNDTIVAQKAYAKATHYQLVATEREMYDSMAPDSYDYIVSLRNSQSRYYSHWNHLIKVATQQQQREPKQVHNHQHQDTFHWQYTIRDDNGTIHPIGNFTKWYQGQSDNYNVRMICGVKCNNIAKYQISKDLFRYTLQRLVLFAHVIFVEDMELSFAKFAKAYKWQYNIPHEEKRTNHGQSLVLDHPGETSSSTTSSSTTTKTTTTGHFAEYWDPYMSILDDAMYEFAQSKYHGASHKVLSSKIQTLDFATHHHELLEEYFRLGPLRDCSNQCCGTCSIW
jgi:hypothetical protein